MKRLGQYYIGFLIVIASVYLLTPSCKKIEGACTTTTVATAQVQYGLLSIKDTSYTQNGFSIDSIMYFYKDTILPYWNAINLEVDTIGLIGTPNYGYFSLFLNPNNNITSYAIRFDTIGSYHDTIRIYHTSVPSYISNECGFTNFFKIDSLRYISEVIDSSIMVNDQITLDKNREARMANFYIFKEI